MQLVSTFEDDLTRDEIRDWFLRASVYVLLSLEEGFGLPFVGGAERGCRRAPRCHGQRLTRELLYAGAVLLRDQRFREIGRQLREFGAPSREERQAVACGYSWDKCVFRVGLGPRDGRRERGKSSMRKQRASARLGCSLVAIVVNTD